MAKALNPQSALPSSESSVHERLLALESKQLAYRSLSHRLLELPRKLRRRALVPVGPRLYLPGELVRTNEILVMLGSAGEATYFAERSAWQAYEIVRQRLGRVERGLFELLDEDDGEHNVAAALASSIRVPAADGNGKNGTDVKTVYGKAGTVASASQNERHKETNDDTTGDKTAATRGTTPVSVLKNTTNQPSASTEKKRVRFSNPLIHPSIKSTPQPCFISPPKPKSRSRKKKNTASSSSSPKLTAPDVPPTGAKAEKHEKADNASNAGGHSKAKVMDELRSAVEKAQQQVLHDGIVNITEVYEGDEDTPSRVELPRGFEPDTRINFGDDSEEFLDMTGADNGAEEEGSSREDYLDALAEVEKESQAEEERMATEKRRGELEREKKEFGQGLAKGFFGAAPKKRARADQQHVPKAVAEGGDVPSTQVAKLSTASAVAAVVERKPSRKSKRRNRRPRSSASAFPPCTPTALLAPDKTQLDALGDADADADADEAERQTSLFLRLRGVGKDAVRS